MGICESLNAECYGLSAAGIFSLCLLLLLCCWCCRRRRAKLQPETTTDVNSAGKSSICHILCCCCCCCCCYGRRRAESKPPFKSHEDFTLTQLEEATDNFSETNYLGGGGFGNVYKGKLRDGRFVAVKKLHSCQAKSQFENEVNILSRVSHPHLVRLYGSCSEGLLVYELVENGTLGDHIHKNRGGFMEWDRRLQVVTQTAEALAWLHRNINPPIFHRDVKPANILIDDKYHAKVGDFGISRLVPSLDLTHVTTAPQGTLGYLDPEYLHTCQLTDKSDVYSLGVVLMEVVSSKRAVDMTRDESEVSLAAFATSRIQRGQLETLIDPRLGTAFDPVSRGMVEAVVELSLACLADSKNERPCMREVALILHQISGMGSVNEDVAERKFETLIIEDNC